MNLWGSIDGLTQQVKCRRITPRTQDGFVEGSVDNSFEFEAAFCHRTNMSIQNKGAVEVTGTFLVTELNIDMKIGDEIEIDGNIWRVVRFNKYSVFNVLITDIEEMKQSRLDYTPDEIKGLSEVE